MVRSLSLTVPCLCDLMSGWQSCRWPADWQGPAVFISLPLNIALGGKKRESRREERRWGVGKYLGGSVATRQCAYQQLLSTGETWQATSKAHSLPTSTIWHTHERAHGSTYVTGGHAIVSFSVQMIVKASNRVIRRLKDVPFQPLLPKLLALSREVCFYDCSGFCVNELKFHLSGAQSPCQHILQIESWASLTSTHRSHRASLIGSSPLDPSPQDREWDREI